MFPVPLQLCKGSKNSNDKSFDEKTERSPAENNKGRDINKKSREYKFCLPEKILERLKEIEEQPPKIVGFSTARLKYLISTIVTHRQDKHPGAYSVLNMGYLKNIVPRAGEYLHFMKDQEIIEWINYSAGRNSRLYRLTKQYEGNIVYRTITDNYLIKRIELGYSRIKLQNSKKYPFLNKFVNMVEIDDDAASKTIERIYAENPDKEKAEARRSFSIGEVLKITAGHIYIKVNSTNFRYDCNFTRLPGELVRHLSITGKPLIELDITNSQPFFATALFDPSPVIQKIIGHRFTMYAKNTQLAEKLDVKMYTSLVTTGRFYDFMAKQFDKYQLKYTDRRDLKKQCFTVFFGKNNALHYRAAVKLFSKLFPNVYALFAKIKEGDHSRLAILLQRIEAYIMLDCVARKINTTYPGMEFITKHDSILPAIAPDESDLIRNLIQEEIADVIGFSPVIMMKGT